MEKAIKKMKWAGLAAVGFLGWASTAFAQPVGTQSITLTNPLGSNASFSTVTTAIMVFLFNDIAIPLCIVMTLVGAFQMMSAGGDPEKFSKGRKTLMYAAIGFAVALLAGGLASLLQSILNPSGS